MCSKNPNPSGWRKVLEQSLYQVPSEINCDSTEQTLGKLCNYFGGFSVLNHLQISESCIKIMHNSLLKLYNRNCSYNESLTFFNTSFCS